MREFAAILVAGTALGIASVALTAEPAAEPYRVGALFDDAATIEEGDTLSVVTGKLRLKGYHRAQPSGSQFLSPCGSIDRWVLPADPTMELIVFGTTIADLDSDGHYETTYFDDPVVWWVGFYRRGEEITIYRSLNGNR